MSKPSQSWVRDSQSPGGALITIEREEQVGDSPSADYAVTLTVFSQDVMFQGTSRKVCGNLRSLANQIERGAKALWVSQGWMSPDEA